MHPYIAKFRTEKVKKQPKGPAQPWVGATDDQLKDFVNNGWRVRSDSRNLRMFPR